MDLWLWLFPEALLFSCIHLLHWPCGRWWSWLWWWSGPSPESHPVRGGDRPLGGGRPRGHERKSVSRIGQSVEVQQPNNANVTRTCGSCTTELEVEFLVWVLTEGHHNRSTCLQWPVCMGHCRQVNMQCPGHCQSRGRSRISPRWGANSPDTILPNFPQNCMKLKEFGPRGGGASKILLCRSATADLHVSNGPCASATAEK